MKVRNEILSIVAFIILLLTTIYFLDRLFIPKWITNDDNSHSFITRGYYAEPKNTIDVLFLGNSDTYRGISPMKIWEDYNITSYSYVSAGQRIWTCYYMLKEALKTQKPKVIFLNVDNFFFNNQSSIGNYKKVFDNMKLSKNKIDALTDKTFNFSYGQKASMIMPILGYHSRYNELTKDDFKYALSDYYNPHKGMDITTVKKGYTKDYIYESDKRAKLNDTNKKYIDLIVKTAKEEGIDIEFIWIPSPDSWKRERSNTVSDYAKENGIKFTDLNLNYKDFKLDFKEDTCDEGDHLNVYGATKVSEYLGKYINDNYKFDKHDEKLITRWNKDLETYKNDIKELEKLGK